MILSIKFHFKVAMGKGDARENQGENQDVVSLGAIFLNQRKEVFNGYG